MFGERCSTPGIAQSLLLALCSSNTLSGLRRLHEILGIQPGSATFVRQVLHPQNYLWLPLLVIFNETAKCERIIFSINHTTRTTAQPHTTYNFRFPTSGHIQKKWIQKPKHKSSLNKEFLETLDLVSDMIPKAIRKKIDIKIQNFSPKNTR